MKHKRHVASYKILNIMKNKNKTNEMSKNEGEVLEEFQNLHDVTLTASLSCFDHTERDTGVYRLVSER